MNKRNIYREIAIGQLQQGYIFNQAVSDDYTSNEIHGIIITPRCDIENEKVLTFHYLPIVKMEDWFNNDYWFILRKILIKNLRQSVNQILSTKGISQNLIDTFKLEVVRDKFESQFQKKQKESFVKQINWLIEIKNSDRIITKEFLEKIHEEKSFNKAGVSILKDLGQNNRKEFYLIEDWGITDKYYVVLLREIQKMSWELGMKIAKGVHNNTLDAIHFEKSDLKNCTDGFIAPITAIKSPFIEHLVQKFFTNFGRIGISDHEPNLETKLIKENFSK